MTIDADGHSKCAPYRKDQNGQWDRSSGWSATVNKGGSTIYIDGPMNPDAMVAGNTMTILPAPLNTGSISMVAGGGFACVVGIGALARKKMMKAAPTSDNDVEPKGSQANIV